MYSCAYVEKSEHDLMETVLSALCGFQGSDSGHQAYTASKGSYPLGHLTSHPPICGTLEKVQIVNLVLLHLENG